MRPRDPHPGHRSVTGGLARASVFGINDGLVSNVSLLLGFAASGVDVSVVRLAGIAGAVAGAISMAAGEWVSVSAQNDLIERELDVERRELQHNPEFETAELAAMYESHGIDAGRAARAAEEVMREPATALVVHAREELGIDPDDLPSPVLASVTSLVCFLFGAVLPLVPWYFGSGDAASLWSIGIGVVTAAVVGALVGRFAERPMWITAVRQVGIVIGACAVTYVIGELIGVNVAG